MEALKRLRHIEPLKWTTANFTWAASVLNPQNKKPDQRMRPWEFNCGPGVSFVGTGIVSVWLSGGVIHGRYNQDLGRSVAGAPDPVVPEGAAYWHYLWSGLSMQIIHF